MPKATTYQCPNCNGVMTFDAATGQLVCEFCGVTFSEGEHDKAIPLGDAPVQAAATDHVKTVEEFLEHAPWKVDAAEYANSVEYTCPSCGAGVVADQSTVSTECPYCGNNMLVQGIATEKNIPRWVLPFSVTREEAEARMNEHFEHKWYLSRQFSAALEHMQGVYVPYGNSCIASPWGDFIAHADENEQIIYGDIDLDKVDAIREQLPLLKHRRPELY